MKITAVVDNQKEQHRVTVSTNDTMQTLTIAPKFSGYGSSINGGELLFLALATCYCNDVYREASKRKIQVERVEVTVEGEFGAEGEIATHVRYAAKISAHATDEEIYALGREADRLAEIQNTLRTAVPIVLSAIEAADIRQKIA